MPSNEPDKLWADDDSKENRYLRWLAFYYLSRREYSRYELYHKLIAKGCDDKATTALLQEFADKGYQSDERFAYMVVRENLRKGRGKRHIQATLAKAQARLSVNLDELIDEAIAQSAGDGVVLEQAQGVDWLQLAIDARCKKYGDRLPTDAKDKARQLRFLQYRGFELGVCFDALKYTMQSYEQSR